MHHFSLDKPVWVATSNKNYGKLIKCQCCSTLSTFRHEVAPIFNRRKLVYTRVKLVHRAENFWFFIQTTVHQNSISTLSYRVVYPSSCWVVWRIILFGGWNKLDIKSTTQNRIDDLNGARLPGIYVPENVPAFINDHRTNVHSSRSLIRRNIAF